jgi:hypothetical protein
MKPNLAATDPSAPERGATTRARAVGNYAIFAAVAITAGWAGIALDKATAAPASNTLGMLVYGFGPADARGQEHGRGVHIPRVRHAYGRGGRFPRLWSHVVVGLTASGTCLFTCTG